MNGLSKYYIKKIINCFSSEMTATETSRKLKINRNTVNKYYRIIREAIVDYQELQFRIQSFTDDGVRHLFSWNKNKGLILQLQKSCPLFSLVAPNANRVFISTITPERLEEEFGVTLADEVAVEGEEQDSLTGGDALGHELHAPTYVLKDKANITAPSQGAKNTDTGRNFFIYAKEKLTKFYGVKEQYTYLYLKELEFRFNNQDKDLAKLIWKILPHHSPKWIKSSRYRR